MIFNLFKSKPTLKELIPEGFVDIHSHILPGIDDGAKNTEESVELIKKMKELGFSKIIGTPHSYPGLYNNTGDSIKKSYEKLKKELTENINIDYASEYMLDSTISEKAKNKKLLCLKNEYVLIEMSFHSAPFNLYEIIFEIIVSGYIPILAHPERYIYLNSNYREFLKLKKAGCLFQANLLSATDYYGKNVSKILDRLLSDNLIDFVGSDIHNSSQIKYFDNRILIKNIDHFKKSIEKNKIFDS